MQRQLNFLLYGQLGELFQVIGQQNNSINPEVKGQQMEK